MIYEVGVAPQWSVVKSPPAWGRPQCSPYEALLGPGKAQGWDIGTWRGKIPNILLSDCAPKAAIPISGLNVSIFKMGRKVI